MTFLRAWFFTQIATCAILFRQRDIALDYYGKIVAQRPRDTLTLSRVAFLHAEAGDRARAISEFEQVVVIAPADADSWFNLGFLRQEMRLHATAIDAFTHAVAINERHDRAWYGQAISLMALGRHTDAIAPLKKNIDLQPMSPYGHMALARTYFKLGDAERCEKRMRKLKAFDPQNTALLEDETGIKVGIERWWKK